MIRFTLRSACKASGGGREPDLFLKNSSKQYQIGLHAIEMLRPQPHEHVLDVGCGTGEVTARIAEIVVKGRVLGIEADPRMVEAARHVAEQRGPKNLKFKQEDAAEITFQAEFETIFSNISIHWIEDLDRTFKALYQALKPGGRLLISKVFVEPPREGEVRSSMVTASVKDLDLLIGFVANGQHTSNSYRRKRTWITMQKCPGNHFIEPGALMI